MDDQSVTQSGGGPASGTHTPSPQEAAGQTRTTAEPGEVEARRKRLKADTIPAGTPQSQVWPLVRVCEALGLKLIAPEAAWPGYRKVVHLDGERSIYINPTNADVRSSPAEIAAWQKAGLGTVRPDNDRYLRVKLDAALLEDELVRGPESASRFEVDVDDMLRDLIGVQLTTISGRPNRILGVRPPVIVVATDRSPGGSPVPIADVARALEILNSEGSVEIIPDAIGYRSAFVGAVLKQLPDTRVDGTSPPRIVHDPHQDNDQDLPEDLTSQLPAPSPFQGDLDRPVTARQRREQRKLRSTLLAGRDEAPCALCGEIYPPRFLWASHIKRRSAATQDEARDLPHVAMLACIFGCDALFEDGYIAVQDGALVGTGHVDDESAIGRRVRALEGRHIGGWQQSARYFEWHHENVFRSSSPVI
ncbi:hypothetical protein [Cellulomonas sp.]|uniref:hypothetical protein n=1 Tax=Cellulomonas sp. TaxID=40001 RepID=UPI003BAAE12E